MVNSRTAVWTSPLCTRVTNLASWFAVGVPEMLPTSESESPAGSDPASMVQVYTLSPPVASRLVL